MLMINLVRDLFISLPSGVELSLFSKTGLIPKSNMILKSVLTLKSNLILKLGFMLKFELIFDILEHPKPGIFSLKQPGSLAACYLRKTQCFFS